MERLTSEGDFCDMFYDKELCAEHHCEVPNNGCLQKQLWERLKHYEDLEEQGKLVPVVHGEWINSPNIMECVVCSNCMSDNLSAQVIAPAPPYYKYCPNCGAKMDGGNEK